VLGEEVQDGDCYVPSGTRVLMGPSLSIRVTAR
jgi:hypothetical protein